MSKFIKAALASSVLAASVMGAGAAQAATATADARANILAEVTLTNDAGTALDFGTIVVDGTGGAVVVDNAGNLSSCGGALVCSGSTDAADFTVGGTALETVNVSIPASVILSNGTDNMTATLTSTVTGGAVALDGAGAAAFSVGGSLAVGGSQPDGAYTGTFTVTADYP